MTEQLLKEFMEKRTAEQISKQVVELCNEAIELIGQLEVPAERIQKACERIFRSEPDWKRFAERQQSLSKSEDPNAI